jgi:2,3-bisphosphoglycerate-dependent phosphoglycerate mutase
MEDRVPTRIVLVRHGESQVAVDQLIGGHEGCTGLSDLGRRQVEALRDRLARTGELGEVDVLLASILPRAIETAEIISPAIGDLKVDTTCDLCEQHPGEADGLTWAEWRERWGDNFDPATQHSAWAPGAETWAEFMARAGTALWQVVREHEGRTVVVACHGGIVHASFNAFGNLPLRKNFELPTENTSLTEWSLPADSDRRWQLVRYNDAAHLQGLGSPDRRIFAG